MKKIELSIGIHKIDGKSMNVIPVDKNLCFNGKIDCSFFDDDLNEHCEKFECWGAKRKDKTNVIFVIQEKE